MTAILGLSAFYHDSAASLVVDGEIVAAAQEERFSRKKHDAAFPHQAIEYCLSQAGLRAADLDHVGFYEKPLLKFDRLIETYLSFAPAGFWSFRKAMPEWASGKLQLRREIRRGLAGDYQGRICFCEHHESHAASAFFPSPFEQAAILTMDGVGEWATTSLGVGKGNHLEVTDEIHFPHSIGLLYSAFTYFAGFRVNSGEYKLMGLAPYGEPKYVDVIGDKLITIHDDGSYRLHLEYFNYCQGLTMTSSRFHKLFGRRPRTPDSPIEQLDMDLAASVQKVTEQVILRTATHLHAKTEMKNLCMAGGVALNCVANGRLLREGPFEQVWIQPAAGDAGGAIGVALLIWHQLMDKRRTITLPDRQSGSLLGPAVQDSTSPSDLADLLDEVGAIYERFDDPQALVDTIAKQLADGKVVGRVQGRMEFGPRALGNRSILADPRRPQMQSVLNLKIKFRESFRPFAPIVLSDRASEYFDLKDSQESPYMLVVCGVQSQHRVAETGRSPVGGLDRVSQVRSSIPAVTHLDYSARVQTVDAVRNKPLHELLTEFESQTGCPVLVNTSFNVRGEPIVCTAADALRCFMATEMDLLVIENYLLLKANQTAIDVHALSELGKRRSADEMSPRDLAMFLASLVASVLLVAAIAHFKWQATVVPSVLAVIALLVAMISLAIPASRQPIHDAFKAITFPIRFVVTLLILGIVYLGMLTPIGVIRRLAGHAMQNPQANETSTWKQRTARDLASYFNTY